MFWWWLVFYTSAELTRHEDAEFVGRVGIPVAHHGFRPTTPR